MKTQPDSKPHETPVPPDADAWLSVAEAAQAVGVSEQALRKRIRKGTLAARKLLRGSQVLTVLARAELEAAYPDLRAPRSEGSSEAAPAPASPDGEAHVRLREELAASLAAGRAAEARARQAETRARTAEEKLESALVRRGDEIAQARRDAERGALQMALEIARAQVAALPAPEGPPAARSSPWTRLAGLLSLALAIAALAWGGILWRGLHEARSAQDTLRESAASARQETIAALGRAADLEASARRADEDARAREETLSADRDQLAASLEQERRSSDALRERLAAEQVERARLVVTLRTLRALFAR